MQPLIGGRSVNAVLLTPSVANEVPILDTSGPRTVSVKLYIGRDLSATAPILIVFFGSSIAY
jgi:hypothetical protein